MVVVTTMTTMTMILVMMMIGRSVSACFISSYSSSPAGFPQLDSVQQRPPRQPTGEPSWLSSPFLLGYSSWSSRSTRSSSLLYSSLLLLSPLSNTTTAVLMPEEQSRKSSESTTPISPPGFRDDLHLFSLEWPTVSESSYDYADPRTSLTARTTAPSPNTTSARSSSSSSSSSWPPRPRSWATQSVREIWRWKDAVLGDGRDLFVPRPQTLQALSSEVRRHGGPVAARLWQQQQQQQHEQKHSSSSTSPLPAPFTIQECIILSNCARFEVLLRVELHPPEEGVDESSSSSPRTLAHPTGSISMDSVVPLLQQSLSALLWSQKLYFQQQALWMQQIPLDWPAHIQTDGYSWDQEEFWRDHGPAIQDLTPFWSHLAGAEAVTRHVGIVAAGMARQPRHPQYRATFRPFSSRDAHILLQLKRTHQWALAASTGSTTTRTTPAGGSTGHILPLILSFGLQAGKKVRQETHVPELAALRPYGTPDARKYYTEPPRALTEQVAQAAMDRVVEPCIRECLQSLVAQEHAVAITTLRERALSLATNAAEQALIQQKLHGPTMALRQGQMMMPVESFLADLEKALKEQRQQLAG